MISEYDNYKENLNELITIYNNSEQERNEATTRLQLIDRIFLDCLGWKKDDLCLEEPYGPEYADYCFYRGGSNVMIVEAKREGDYFEVPYANERLIYSLSSIIQDNPNLHKAVKQVLGYCQKRNVEIAVVCNGHQLIAFIGARVDGLDSLKGKVLVFPSLDFMHKNFLKLWENLSKEEVLKRKLYEMLVKDTPLLPSKLSQAIEYYPGEKLRNSFQADLQILSDIIFEDISKAREIQTTFLKECYCPSGAFSNYINLSKTILSNRYSALFDSQNPGPALEPAKLREGINPDLIAESFSRRPILLLGDVGVGKTTFINNLIKVEAPEIFEKAITLYLDFGSKAAIATDLRKFLLNEIIKQLDEDYKVNIYEDNFVRGIYHGELLKFSRGIYSKLKEINPNLYIEKEIAYLENKTQNTDDHLRVALTHIQNSWKKQVIVFLDNTDQRTEEIQEEVFLIATEMAEHWPVTVFLPLRPETFNHSKRFGHISGYNPRAFTISPPRIELVVEKRLQFALKLITGVIPVESIQTIVKSKSLENIINAFLNSFNTNDDLKNLIVNISGGYDVRLALDLINKFFGSGHVDTQKISDLQEETGNYIVPLHEFLRAVIYLDNEYYNPTNYTKTNISNVFDVFSNDPKAHFLIPLLISTIHSSFLKSSEGGFVETSYILDELQSNGFTPQQIETALIQASKKKLIEPATRRIPNSLAEMSNYFRITSIGLYHVQVLSGLFPYIDAVLIDTPIFNKEIFDKLLTSNLSPSRQIVTDRLKMVELFRNYLDEIWGNANFKTSSFNWTDISNNLKENMIYIRNRITRIADYKDNAS